MKNFEDFQLIHLFKQDPEGAVRKILEEYQDRIFNLCVYMLGSREDAQDAAQDAFIKLYRSFKNFTPEASIYTWLYRIAVNTCIDYKRRPQRLLVDNGDPINRIAAPGPSPERIYESKEASRLVQVALEGLSSELNTVIILREIEGFSYEDIAEVLQISMGTVKSRISRARDALRQLLRDKL